MEKDSNFMAFDFSCLMIVFNPDYISSPMDAINCSKARRAFSEQFFE